MASRKFQIGDRVIGEDEGPASFRTRTGTIVDFQPSGGYGVRFDAPEIIEYVNSNWIRLLVVPEAVGSLR
jgi:hypothetical protein